MDEGYCIPSIRIALFLEESRAGTPLSSPDLLLERGVLRCGIARPASKDGARHQAAAAGIVVIEEAADQLSGGVQTGDGDAFYVQHPAFRVYLQSAEGECYAAGDSEGEERRGIQRECPVRLGGLDALRALAILYGGIERARLYGGVVLPDGSLKSPRVDADLIRQLDYRGGFVAGHSGGCVLVLPEQVAGLGVEELVSEG